MTTDNLHTRNQIKYPISNILLLALTTDLVLRGLATYYPADQFAGRPLYCHYQDPRLVYDESLPDWIAVDVSLYTSGQVQCGDLFRLTFEDGRILHAFAWDAGDFSGYPVVVDLPEHLRPPQGIAPVTAVNLTALLLRGETTCWNN